MSTQQALERKLLEEDIDQYLIAHQNKELLRFVAVGSVDDGKSTLIGRLLHDSDQVYEDQLADARVNDPNNSQEIDFALLTDGLRAEREQGITIDVAYRYFTTHKRKFIIADTPGHVQYTRNMATGASTANVALILIDARLGVQQQSKRHAYIASLLGIPHLAVCVNKMDLQNFDAKTFHSIQEVFQAFSHKLSFTSVAFLPISAKYGDNVVNKSEQMPWYQGPTVLEYLEDVPIEKSQNVSDFRLPVQYVLRPHQNYRGFAGQISSGTLQKGDSVMVLPSGKTSTIQSIDTSKGELEEVHAPMSVTVRLEHELDVSRGDMLVSTSNKPHLSRAFDAIIFWMSEVPLDSQKTYLLKHTTQIVRAEFDQMYWKSDPSTLETLPTTQLELNEIGKVKLICHKPIFFDPYNINRQTGAFIIIDQLNNNTLAAGLIQEAHISKSMQLPAVTEERTFQKPTWEEFCMAYWNSPDNQVGLDLSHMQIPPSFYNKHSASIRQAFQDLEKLENGEIANPDENRMVGHYWLRAPNLSPTNDIKESIQNTIKKIKSFAKQITNAEIQPEYADQFRHLILVGIGGSALGPQWLYDALRDAKTPMQAYFIDNTDPAGIDRLLDDIGDGFEESLVMVVSKSGGTKETRNGMLELQAIYNERGLNFGKHAIAVTGEGSALEKLATEQGFLEIFPMWDWVGGRTSLFSAVGLLPAALLGFDIDGLLHGAEKMDQWTRIHDRTKNPAMQMALAWLNATEGVSKRAMALIPYKDRLGLFGRYTQQLVMESIGKKFDRQGNAVHQGLTVFGNKGSTDQHALIQQLREGPDDFFMVFIEVKQDRTSNSIEVDRGVTSGDYLLGFLLGTREALRQSYHPSLTLSLPDCSAKSLGMLVALFERAVSFYASLIDINAYHQPGVEAGKKAAGFFIELQGRVLSLLKVESKKAFTIKDIVTELGVQEHADALFFILEHLVTNGRLQSSQTEMQNRTYQYKLEQTDGK